jgi:hypothetical protein
MSYYDSSNYAGEPFLIERLPNYENERIMLVTKLVLAFLFFILLGPIMFSREVENPEANKKIPNEKEEEDQTSAKKGSKKKVSQKRKAKKELKNAVPETPQPSPSPKD